MSGRAGGIDLDQAALEIQPAVAGDGFSSR